MCKQITFKEAERILYRNGYQFEKIKGSHHHYVKDGKRIVINLKLHHLVWRRLCKEYNLQVD